MGGGSPRAPSVSARDTPSILGSRMSVTTAARSRRIALNISNASCASAAAITRYSPCSDRVRILRMRGSSSTTSTSGRWTALKRSSGRSMSPKYVGPEWPDMVHSGHAGLVSDGRTAMPTGPRAHVRTSVVEPRWSNNLVTTGGRSCAGCSAQPRSPSGSACFPTSASKLPARQRVARRSAWPTPPSPFRRTPFTSS
jgi:hypothetical protein